VPPEISTQHFQVIIAVTSDEPLSPDDIATALTLDQPNTTMVVEECNEDSA
jgi:DNA-binding MarR family transcriptional regulator